MLLNNIREIPRILKIGYILRQNKFCGVSKCYLSTRVREDIQSIQSDPQPQPEKETFSIGIAKESTGSMPSEMFPTSPSRVVPILLAERDPVVLSFDEIPGPSSLKLLARARSYLSSIGTQLTAGALTLGVNIGSYVMNRKPTTVISTLFDEYGPVVRFVSPVGGDIVLINHPDHIQKVFATEGNQPVRSTLDSLEKYRMQHRNSIYTGFYNLQGKEWSRQRNLLAQSLHSTVVEHFAGLDEVSHKFVNKVYNTRDCHDEISKNFYNEVHKWAFDCMGHLIFSKKFTMLDTEVVYNQCDMSWLYHSLEKSTEAILKCESGLQMWKVMPTFAWSSLVKHCESLDNLIGKHVVEADQKIAFATKGEDLKGASFINALLLNEEKLTPEDISTILMDMLLIGVNTISSSTSFLMYYLAKHQKVQKLLYQEIQRVSGDMKVDVMKIMENTPYLQACIKETLRISPPIPMLTRILPKNVTLDRYNIPRGTLIMMSTQDASLKESNFDDATKFHPERWLLPGAKEYHAFASIPFGFGARKCLGQNIAEMMISLLTFKMLQKFKLEYHYGDVHPTRTFIARPDKLLKIRFIDRT